MNAKTRVCVISFVFVCTVSLFLNVGTMWAQSSNSNCKQIKGQWVDVYPGTGAKTFGSVSNAGTLNGTTEAAYNSAAFPTPASTVVSYTSSLTITTVSGRLTTTNVHLYDFSTGLFTILARIDPGSGTGIFAGATGVLYATGNTVGNGLTYVAELSGEICSVKQ
jgi:hypothetical protein